MHRYRKLLVGVAVTSDGLDISAGSRRAVQQAAWLAQRTGAAVTLFHSTWPEYELASPDDITSMLEAEAAYCEQQGVATDIALSSERPWLAMTQRVLAGDSDFVVVAKRRAPQDDGRHIGVNARKLLRKCPSPVWAVHPEGPVRVQRVLIATDLTPVSAHAAKLGKDVAEAAGAELHAVHAWKLSMELQMEHSRLSESEYAARLAAVERAASDAVLAEIGETSTSPQLHVCRAAPDQAILQAVDAFEPDLLVMGTLSRGGIPGVFIGNTAERLFDRVQCSLLAVKPEGFVSPVPKP